MGKMDHRKRERDGQGETLGVAKRVKVEEGARNSVQQLWKRIHYGPLLECFQSLDVRNNRRLSRVCRDWKLFLSNVPIHNKGVLFLSFYKAGDEQNVNRRGTFASRTDARWIRLARPADYYVGSQDTSADRSRVPMDKVSLSVLLGASLQNVKHLICDGRGFVHFDPLIKFIGTSEDSLLKKETHQISKITLCNRIIDESYYYTNTILKHVGPSTPEIEFVNCKFSFDVGLKGIWDATSVPTYYAEHYIPRMSITFPIDRSGLTWVDTSREEDWKGVPPWYIGWYHRWMYEGLRNCNALWNCSVEQIEWFRHCLDMVPAGGGPDTVGGRTGLKLDLEKSGTWMKEKNLDGIIPKTDLYLDGYQLDKLECEILAQWFQKADDPFIKELIENPCSHRTRRPKLQLVSKYPKPPSRFPDILSLKINRSQC